MPLPWRRKPNTEERQGAALDAWEALHEARRAYERAKDVGDRLEDERRRNHLEDLFRRALGGKE